MVVVAKITALDGREKEVENALRNMVDHVRSEEGTLVYTLHRDMNNPKVFLFYEKYKDGDALAVHSKTPHFKELFKALAPMMDGQPDIGMYEELAGL